MAIDYTIQHTNGRLQTGQASGARVRIGRSPESEIAFDDDGNESVSWDHAVIACDRQAVIEDSGSTNGTFLNGRSVTTPAVLSSGDAIKLGREGPTVVIRTIRIEADPPASESDGNSTAIRIWAGGGIAACVAVFFAIFVVNVLKSTEADVPPKSDATELADAPQIRTRKTEVAPRLSRTGPVPPVPATHLLSQAASEAQVADEPKPPLSLDEIRHKFAPAIVWLGVTLNENKFPWCSGWIIGRNKVVTTAERIIDLEKFGTENNASTFVYHDSLPKKFAAVSALLSHTNYDHQDPSLGESLLHNAGIIRVEGLPTVQFDSITSNELSDGLQGMDVYVCAFAVPDDNQEPYNRLSAPELVVISGSIVGTRSFPNCDEYIPLLHVKLSTPDPNLRLDGALVVDKFGRAIGVLTELSDGFFVVHIENFGDLVE